VTLWTAIAGVDTPTPGNFRLHQSPAIFTELVALKRRIQKDILPAAPWTISNNPD
jgi:hypothetical protein